MKANAIKRITAIVLSLASGMSIPGSTFAISLKDGAYFGVDAGYDLMVYQETLSLQNPIVQSTASRNHVGQGAIGGIFAGYGRYFSKLYLGGELFINGYTGKDKSSASQTQGGVNVTNASDRKINNSFGLDALPGIKLNDNVLLYGRLGFARGNFSSNLTRSTSVTGSLPPVSSSTNLHGLDTGIGVETAVTDHVSMRTEFKHTHYYGDVIVNPGANFTPSDNAATVGLTYRF